MAVLEPRIVRCLASGSLLLSCACTVFNGLAVPEVDGGVPCDLKATSSDPDHCGICGHSCLGGTCVNGICQPEILAQATGIPTDLQLDEAFLYFTTSEGTVGRVGKSGADQRGIVFGIAQGLDRLALDANHIYFTSEQAGIVYAAAKDGSNQTIIATNQPYAYGIASDGETLYWTTHEGTNYGWIGRARLHPDGRVDVSKLIENRQFPREIVVDGANVFWGENYQAILQIPKDASSAPIEITTCNRFGAIALDDTSVYWTSTEPPSVRRSTKGDASGSNGCDAPSVRTLVEERGLGGTTDVGLYGLYVAGTMLVYTEQQAGLVKAIDLGPSCPSPPCVRVLASNQASPTRIVADSHAAYWINEGDSSIVKVAF